MHTKMTEKTIVVAKYKRCSTDKQDLELQDQILNKTIRRLKEDNPKSKYHILDFSDRAFSGKSAERPQFQKMMESTEKGKIDLIIFSKLDRLARSLQDLLNITSKFEKHRVKFIVTEQNIDTSTYHGRLQFQIMGAFAEFERNIIIERMQEGRKKAELAGSKSGKPCHRPLVKIDEDGVRFKFQHGMSMRQIAKQYGVSITPIRRILNE
jgi:DNA invertase Pin-like site-specific DNA recombinase